MKRAWVIMHRSLLRESGGLIVTTKLKVSKVRKQLRNLLVFTSSQDFRLSEFVI